MCNQLPATELLNFNLKSHDPSKYNCVIDYQKSVIDYQWRFLEKAFWKDTSLQTILKRHEEPIYMCVWLQKRKRERYSKRTSLPNTLSTTLGKHLQIYWEFIQELQFVSFALKERNLYVHLRKSVVIKRLVISWVVTFLNTREKDSSGVQKL